MDSPSERVEPSAKGSGLFTTTHWTTVLAAGEGPSSLASAALEKLCQTDWYPLYAFARRQGHAPEDAQDLTQAFFERFLEKNYLKDVARERGRFHSFLLAALRLSWRTNAIAPGPRSVGAAPPSFRCSMTRRMQKRGIRANSRAPRRSSDRSIVPGPRR